MIGVRLVLIISSGESEGRRRKTVKFRKMPDGRMRIVIEKVNRRYYHYAPGIQSEAKKSPIALMTGL
jgi:hypothetical protein